jgi:hypothetical protein
MKFADKIDQVKNAFPYLYQYYQQQSYLIKKNIKG